MALGFGKQIGLGGLSEWIDPRRQALIGLGAGLVGGQDWSQGISQGLQGAQQGMQADNAYAQMQQAEAQKQEQLNQTIQWLQNKGREDLIPLVNAGQANIALQEAMKPASGFGSDAPASVQEYQFYADQATAAGEQPMPYSEWRKGSNQTVRAGLGQPIAMRNRASGEYAPFQPMSDGTMINTLTGQPANQAEWVYDPSAVTADKARVTIDEKTAGTARKSLPGAENAYTMTTKTLDSLIGPTPDPNLIAGKKEQFGDIGLIPQQMTGAWPKTAKADFRNVIKQLSGQAFLAIRESLKGAGQVTDFEGARAEDALSRMSAAADNGSEADFDQALKDYKDAIDNGMRLLREQAQGEYAAGSPNVTGASPTGTNTTASGVSWSVE